MFTTDLASLICYNASHILKKFIKVLYSVLYCVLPQNLFFNHDSRIRTPLIRLGASCLLNGASCLLKVGRVVFLMWGELSSERGASCLLNVGRVFFGASCLGASCFWGELS